MKKTEKREPIMSTVLNDKPAAVSGNQKRKELEEEALDLVKSLPIAEKAWTEETVKKEEEERIKKSIGEYSNEHIEDLVKGLRRMKEALGKQMFQKELVGASSCIEELIYLICYNKVVTAVANKIY